MIDKSFTTLYHPPMTQLIYRYSSDKNKLLIRERHVSFEEIIAAIDGGQLLDIIEHPNKDKYPSQKMYVVQMNGYAYLVPFIEESDNSIFLKTIFPSRKAKKHYIDEVYNEK